MDERLIPDDLISPDAAAQLLGLGVATVYRWLNRGKLAGWRVGYRKLRVSRADVLGMVKPVRRAVESPAVTAKVNRFTLEVLKRFKVV